MGLDMYLTGKRYLSEYDNQDKVVSADVLRHLPEVPSGATVKEVSVRVGYWRKANHIHRWFVDNVQDGTDDCGSYHVSLEKMQELRQLCQQVVDFRHLAVERLPTSDGFFFGTTEYDEYYFASVEHTVKVMDAAIKLANSPSLWSIEYSSSW